MEEKIVSILKEVFDIEKVNSETSQSNCEKWDSLHHLNLVVELESEFDISLEPEEIAEMKSVNDIKRILANKAK